MLVHLFGFNLHGGYEPKALVAPKVPPANFLAEKIKKAESSGEFNCSDYLLADGGKELAALAQLPNLHTLHANNCGITDIGALAPLKNLKRLELANNKIEDINSLANLLQLKYLDLSCNQIINANAIIELKQLRELYITGNELTGLNELFAYFSSRHDLCNVNLLGLGLTLG